MESEHLARQLNSLEKLHDIVRSMKALSATSIRQYEQSVDALSGYYRTIELGLYVALKDRPTPLFRRQTKNAAAIVFGSDHGLCGRFNEVVVRQTISDLSDPGLPDNPFLLAIGARVAGVLEALGQPVSQTVSMPGSAARITVTVREILLTIDDWRQRHDLQDVYIYYNRTRGRNGYEPVGFRLLPVDLPRFYQSGQRWPTRALPMFTMERETLLRHLLYQYLFVAVFRACAESQASEHASRLEAMQAAEDHIEERAEQLAGMLRRARQEAITSELMDVVTGYQTLVGSGVDE